MQSPVDSLAYIDYIKCDGLSLAIAIQPQNQFIGISRLILHIFDYIYVVFHGYLLQVNYLEVRNVGDYFYTKCQCPWSASFYRRPGTCRT